ncbi:MAG: polysaccharide biosynthesis protein [Alloprevotella sp.]|nr:polysaccharide biosynthesis protein [Alloprevotella sp.]
MYNPLRKLSNWYFSKRALPYWAVLLMDSLIVYGMGLFAHQQFFGALKVLEDFAPLSGMLLLYLLFYCVGFRVFNTYAGILRYSSFTDLMRVGGAVLVAFSLSYAVHFIQLKYIPELYPLTGREIIVTALGSTLLMWVLRVLVKTVYESTGVNSGAKRVYIYGVRDGGIGLAKSIRVEKPMRFKLCGFISDEGHYGNKLLQGVKVHPLASDILERMRREDVEVLLVSPRKTRDFLANKKFQDELIDAGVRIYFVPSSADWTNSPESSARHLRPINIEDLLARDVIEVDLESVRTMLAGRRVLITGSAGSIGSEIVRQVAAFAPARMVLIDQAETPQHDLRLAMAQDFPDVEAETIVASVCEAGRMEDIFRSFRPEYVFHAAAYKHVPMMEDNPAESVRNNVYGTKVLADLAVKYGTSKFVMISTDKAVNPTNVMGCSKRICEIYVQSLDKAVKEGRVPGTTQFVTTRFGNVLGSNGSVIPLFRKQIAAGGPITVTHPDIIRYFMLIPEACKLVLEAGTKGNGGEIFVFDMGESVRIADLARRMIKLSGAKNVEIRFTGLREGEKLYEEVLNDAETSKPTFHKKIWIASVREYDYAAVADGLERLFEVSTRYDAMEIVRQMKCMVPEYKSRNSKYEILDENTEKE